MSKFLNKNIGAFDFKISAISNKISNINIQALSVIFIGLILLIIGKDLMHSSIRNYSFYLSESLLFGTFWLIFIPLIFINKLESKKKMNLFLPVVYSLVHLVFFALLVFLLSTLLLDHTFGFYQTFLQTTSEYGIVCLLVYSLSSFPFVVNQSSLKKIPQHKKSEKIKVAHQNKVVVLSCDDILYVKSEKPYIALVTKERTYLHKSSLKKFLEEKATNDFMQIHRSTIINTNFIVSYTSRKNGDYDVEMANQYLVRASRSFNSKFKSLFDDIDLD